MGFIPAKGKVFSSLTQITSTEGTAVLP